MTGFPTFSFMLDHVFNALAGKEEELIKLVNKLDKAPNYGMEIRAEKAKLMNNNTE